MIVTAFIISLIVLFLHVTTFKGHIFEGIRKIIPPKGKLYKPIYGCNVCMVFWHGTYIYLLFFADYSLPFKTIFIDWGFTIFVASGISVIWMCLLELREAAANYNKQFED